MMPVLLQSLLFYYLNGDLNGVKDKPNWLVEACDNLEDLLAMDSMDIEESDKYTTAIMDLKEAAELWGFMNGIRFASEVFKEL